MTLLNVAGSVGPNGKAILERLITLKGRKDIEFTETVNGFHICLSMNGQLIPLIQMWGKSENKGTSQIIETRKQWFPESLELTREEEIQIFRLFRNANFKQTSGIFLNLRMSYGEENEPFLKIGPTQLDNIEKALMVTIEILQKRTSASQ